MYLKPWILAARLQTIPLSISGILIASAIAYSHNAFDVVIFIFTMITAIGFQVISNFANDYGDGVKGTDSHRTDRTVQSEDISPNQMKYAIIISSGLTFCSAIILIFTTFSNLQIVYVFIFLGLTLLAVTAAIKYTVGKYAYGYKGFGDIFVFIFFGLVSVLGALFLYIKDIPWKAILPATAVGLLSVGVLNVNNMRDYQTDKVANKNTLIVFMGVKLAKLYHYNLILLAMLCFMGYSILSFHSWFRLIYIIGFVPLIAHLFRIKSISKLRMFNPELKKLVLTTFIISLLFAVGLVI